METAIAIKSFSLLRNYKIAVSHYILHQIVFTLMVGQTTEHLLTINSSFSIIITENLLIVKMERKVTFPKLFSKLFWKKYLLLGTAIAD